MMFSVALAMLQRDGRWLLQLRDDIDSIIYPGHWGLFGGHLEPGESPAESVVRELKEEISWSPPATLQPWFSDASGGRTVHVFRGELTVPLDQLYLKEGQDLRLASLEELRSEWIWSDHCREQRPIAPGMNIVIRRLLAEMHDV